MNILCLTITRKDTTGETIYATDINDNEYIFPVLDKKKIIRNNDLNSNNLIAFLFTHEMFYNDWKNIFLNLIVFSK